MGRSPCCDENGLKKGPWTPEEDKKLVQYIQKHGHGSWRALPKLAGLNRCGKSCRLRWTNYLRPDIKRGKFSKEEEQTILNLHSVLGNKWSAIATHLPGRTDNEIKNFWNTHIKKKLIQMGFDPKTHHPRHDIFSTLPQLMALANFKEVMDHQPWEECAGRLQEAFQLVKFQYLLQSAGTMTSISNNVVSSIADINAVNTLNSMQCNQENAAMNDQLPYYPSLDLQFPCNFSTSMSNEINQDSDTALFSQGDYTPQSPLLPSPPSLGSENSINNGGDASCNSSYDGSASPFWPEFFLDDLFFA